MAHPKAANKIIGSAEKQIRAFREEAEKAGDYYPYSKCDLTIYSVTGKDKLSALQTRVEIGDGEQTDLADHLSQVCQRGKEKQAVLENFDKSLRERSKAKILTPQTGRESGTEEQSAGRSSAEAEKEMVKAGPTEPAPEKEKPALSMAQWEENLSQPLKGTEPVKEKAQEKESNQNRSEINA